jgi:hypothetical protein
MQHPLALFAIIAALTLSIGCVIFFRYITPEGAGVRACQQAAADAVKAGRDGLVAQRTCEDRGREIARLAK